jgi:DNA-binding IclR family transcriptional regulator
MLQNAMAVLDLFSFERRELGVLEVARLLGRPKSTISRWLSAMEGAGYLVRDEATARYRISMRLAALGELARQVTSLQREARPVLEWLSRAPGETSNLAVLDGAEAVNVEAAVSPRPIMHVGWIGRRLPLHVSAAGKALLAWRSPAEVERLLPEVLERRTSRTMTDRVALLADLAQARARGYTIAWAELELDMVAAGAPVRDHRGEVVGALAIAAPISRVTREQLGELAGLVVEAARDLSSRLGYREAV